MDKVIKCKACGKRFEVKSFKDRPEEQEFCFACITYLNMFHAMFMGVGYDASQKSSNTYKVLVDMFNTLYQEHDAFKEFVNVSNKEILK